MGAHHAGQRVGVGDGDRLVTKRLGRRHQLFGMGAAAQEGEIRGDVELGVAGMASVMRTPHADTSTGARAALS